ncbi:acyltransferase family protein [Polaribacter haliotis]|uniref:acyltransferase family protein n=1 Tax=Polaribacter haliotis TaxID=1888915 RepID=UPI00293723F0|nr:heparan-alpha-glucosaminide N-acetyltransferase domain-containing protein [Polaribacter haliotis]
MIKKRIESVDILRGITICAMILVNTPGTWSAVYPPLLHAEWHGLTPTDLIFPFFLFIVGISIFFAYKYKNPSKNIYKKIAIRSLKLIGLGLFLNLFIPYFPFLKDFETLRFLGVLQRIGIVFFISAILYLHFNWRVLAGITVSILIIYWVLLGFISMPNGTLPTFNRAPNNWAMYIDSNILGKHMWQPDYDPEGLLSTIPSIASCLIGVLIGTLLDQLKNVKPLLLISLVFLVLGYTLNVWFPINKAIWSSSFVLATSGWATLILAGIYYLVDIKNIKFGGVFKYVGMNAITIYFLSSFISKTFYLTKVSETENIHSFLFKNMYAQSFFSTEFSSLLYAITVVVFYVLLGYILFKKKIFIKV